MLPSVTVVMFNTSNIQSYASLAASINRRYCETHNYRFIHEIYDNVELEPSHEKVKVMRRHLDDGSEYVCWIDSDACFIDFTSKLADFCQSGKDLVIAGHDFGFDLMGERLRYRVNGSPCGLNGGVMLVRNSAWTRIFLDEWWQRCVRGDKIPTSFWEQGHLQNMFLFNTLNIQQHTDLVVPCSRLNRCDDNHTNICEFILHLWGTSTEVRQQIFGQIAQGIHPDVTTEMPFFNVISSLIVLPNVSD